VQGDDVEAVQRRLDVGGAALKFAESERSVESPVMEVAVHQRVRYTRREEELSRHSSDDPPGKSQHTCRSRTSDGWQHHQSTGFDHILSASVDFQNS
jgi:hypothetical protein